MRKEFNLPSAMLTGHDGCLILMLTVCQQKDVEPDIRIRCPARLGIEKCFCAGYGMAARYAAAISIVLLWGKLEDNILDDNSFLSKNLKFLTKSHYKRAVKLLELLDFPVQKLADIFRDQHHIENDKSANDLYRLTAPTGEAVALILSHTSQLTNMKKNAETLTEVGLCLGRLIALIDAAKDYKKDARKFSYNVIRRALPEVRRLSGRMEREYIKHFMLCQLRTVRDKSIDLALHRHHGLVINILWEGVFDGVKEAIERLSSFMNCSDRTFMKNGACPCCGNTIHSNFCMHCGTPRKWN